MRLRKETKITIAAATAGTRGKVRSRQNNAARTLTFLFQVVGGLLMVLALSGCRIAKTAAELPAQAVGAVKGGKSAPLDPANLQVKLQRFSDEYSSRTIAALNYYAGQAGTPEARSEALQWKVSVASAALTIATGENPQANLLDLVALAVITRVALEGFVPRSPHSAALQPWLEVSRSLETDAWNLAGEVLSLDQQTELRDSIQRWWETNPSSHLGFFARPEEFSSLIRQTHHEEPRQGSVFALVGLDPTAGLDPAVREVTRTRLFAERAMFMMQRMPFLIRWHTELLVDELLQLDQVEQALTNATSLSVSIDRLSRAAEAASHTAGALPDLIATERKAILEAFDEQEGKLRQLSADLTQTLAAGEAMSTSLNATLVTFDALMKRFGVGEPSTAPPNTNATPFNILDYAHTAERIAAMAQQLDALLKDTGNTLESPELERQLGTITGRAQADAKPVLTHAFLLLAGLVLLVFICAWVYRRTGRAPGATAP
jgi:hypothetical protein